MVVLEEEAADEKGKKIYHFYYDGDEGGSIMWANHRFVHVLKEGDHMLLFGGYNFDKFEERLKAIYEKNVEERNHAEEDLAYLEEYMENNEVSYFNKKGMIQWQGSEAQEQAWVDLEANAFHDFGYRHIFANNKVYHKNFGYDEFCDKIKQEIRTKKYLHTVKVRDLQKKEKQNTKGGKKKNTNKKQ